jgi:hypothetical protein
MVLEDVGNFMSAMFERKEGNIKGGILDVLKTLLHSLLGGLHCGTSSCPICTRGSYEPGDWRIVVTTLASGGGSTLGL